MTPPRHDPPSVYDWRAVVKLTRRGASLHAFEIEGGDGQGSLSFCGMVPRAATTGPAAWASSYVAGMGACAICLRVAAGNAPLYYGHTPSTLPPSGPTPRVASLDAALATATELATCARAWDPGARLVGNITAAELLAMAEAFLEVSDRRPR